MLFRTLVVSAMTLAASAVAASPGRLAVSFSDSEVVVTGATPKSDVILVGVVHEPRGTHSSVQRYMERLEDTDGDGTWRFEPKQHEITWRAVWGAVDLRTGEYVVASPERSPGKEVGFRGKGLGRGGNGKLTTIEHEGQWLYVMAVASTGDVMAATVVDGGMYDLDGENDNVVRVSFEALDLTRVKGEKPDEYRPGDVVFVVNPDDLSMVAARVK